MNTLLRPFAALLFAVLSVSALIAPPSSGPAAAQACLSQDEARNAVSSGAAMRLGALRQAVNGEIVNAQLCDAGGRLVYRLAVMQKDGQVRNLTVDARSGQVIGN